jgi:hypothetical protein
MIAAPASNEMGRSEAGEGSPFINEDALESKGSPLLV